MNPYASTGSVATVTASVAGKDSLGGPNGNTGGSSSSTSTLEVTRRLLAYVRPYRGAASRIPLERDCGRDAAALRTHPHRSRNRLHDWRRAS